MEDKKMSTSYGDHKFEAKGLPGIHYIWIGPPSPEKDKKTDAGLEIRGHDIEGPMAMAKANKDNPISSSHLFVLFQIGQ